jgi:glutathione S-transferase
VKLYHLALSGHSHRARLFLSILGVDAELIELDASGLRSPDVLRLNPFGQVPVLEDGNVVVADSNAILVYLAKKFGREDWLPESPAEAAAVQKWLSVAANEIANGPGAARLITVFNAPLDARDAIARAHRILALVNQALEGRDWIVGRHPTIADLALYSYTSHAPEGNVDISGYANVIPWLKRIEALPGFLPFPQTAAGLRVSASGVKT